MTFYEHGANGKREVDEEVTRTGDENRTHDASEQGGSRGVTDCLGPGRFDDQQPDPPPNPTHTGKSAIEQAWSRST